MNSLVLRLPLSVPTASNGKLDRAWGTRLVISDSVYERSCAQVAQAAWTS